MRKEILVRVKQQLFKLLDAKFSKILIGLDRHTKNVI